jgi:ABC-type transport system involved in cytochrome c biogenesis permease subunit
MSRILVPFLIVFFAITASAPFVSALRAGELDWSTWRRMPVFADGRIMPLDTFARLRVETVCGRQSPRLGPAADAPGDGPADYLFPGGEAKKFSAAELLFSWLVEPDKWERVPLLIAEYEPLRRDVLEAPIRGDRGQRLKHISPRRFDTTERLAVATADLSERQRRAKAQRLDFEPSGTDRAIVRLDKAYATYRLLTFQPERPKVQRRRFLDKLAAAGHAWGRLEPVLQPWCESAAKDKIASPLARADEAMQKLVGLLRKDGFTLEEADRPAGALRKAAAELADYFADARDRVFDAPMDDDPADDGPADDGPALREQFRAMMNTMAVKTDELARLATEVHLALYDNGRSLRLVPSLNPGAPQPWLNVQTLLFGSEAVLRGYPKEDVEELRRAFSRVKAAYTDRASPDRAERFSAAMDDFAAAVRVLAERIEPLRARLPMRNRDDRLIAATAYPPAGSTRTEVLYNRLDPFFWSWVLSLGAMICFALGFGRLRGPMFWLAIVVLLAGQAATIYGLGLRAAITGMVPVANMFETVLFMGATVSLLGLWFTLLPLLWPGLAPAWRWTAVFGGWGGRGSVPRGVLLAVRACLAVAVFYVLAWGPFGPRGDSAILGLLPWTASGTIGGWLSAVVLWLLGLGLLGWAMWFVPRAVPAVLLSVALVPAVLMKQGIAQPIEQTLARRSFVIAGAWVGFLAYILAYYAPGPVFDREVGFGMAAVLRNNFWLAVHVLTVTSSFGAGALAWGLGNISLAHYLFGRYREASPSKLVPPEPCARLAAFIYKATQVAVLLLAVGTITGAVWADFAWGRYWGWDPKEVWSLVTLLVYAVVLHGRWAGWTGNFGLAVGSVLGATAIIMAWYGVNYVLPGGLHSYGQGAGGKTVVLAAVACNWLFVAAAAIRYRVETRVT